VQKYIFLVTFVNVHRYTNYMLVFRKIELSDKLWVDELLHYSQYRGTEYCFTSIFTWANFFHSTICRYKDLLIVRSESPHRLDYFYPAGRGSNEDFRDVFAKIIEDGKAEEKQCCIVGITKEIIPALKGQIEGLDTHRDISSVLVPYRNSFDYIYLTKDLMTLAGRKYQPKRNHIKHFEALTDWQYEEVTERNIGECIAMNEEWCRENHCIHNLSKQSEACATRCAMNNFTALQLKGGLLRVNGEVIAFSLGEQLNNDTFIVHVEKAFARIDGAYPAINREFIRHAACNTTYVNREDDAGEEGLRKAKLSYHPVFLLEKYVLKLPLQTPLM